MLPSVADIALSEKTEQIQSAWLEIASQEAVPADLGKVDSNWAGVTKQSVTDWLIACKQRLSSGTEPRLHRVDPFAMRKANEAIRVADRLVTLLAESKASLPNGLSSVLPDFARFQELLTASGAMFSDDIASDTQKISGIASELGVKIEAGIERLSKLQELEKKIGEVSNGAQKTNEEIADLAKKIRDRLSAIEKTAVSSQQQLEAANAASLKSTQHASTSEAAVVSAQTVLAQLTELEKRSIELRTQLQALLDEKTKELTEFSANTKATFKGLRDTQTREMREQREIEVKSLIDLRAKHESDFSTLFASGRGAVDQFEKDSKERVDTFMAAANRAGLARSFDDAAKKQRNAAIAFGVLFIAGLAAMAAMGIHYVFPLVKDSSGWERLANVLSGALLSSPAVWLAWVAALRLSDAVRQMSDYRYKTAAALALDGYKKEANEIDPELQKYLVGIAIKHFGEAPHLSASNEPATPFEGMLDRVLPKKPKPSLSSLTSSAQATPVNPIKSLAE
jgi:hypothetical protein